MDARRDRPTQPAPVRPLSLTGPDLLRTLIAVCCSLSARVDALEQKGAAK